jgi:hypothetical protein
MPVRCDGKQINKLFDQMLVHNNYIKTNNTYIIFDYNTYIIFDYKLASLHKHKA